MIEKKAAGSDMLGDSAAAAEREADATGGGRDLPAVLRSDVARLRCLIRW